MIRNAVHLAVLSTFAFAQPLFDLLGKTPEFFVVRGSKALDVIVFALVVVVVPPLVLVAIEALVRLVSREACRFVHLAVVGALAAVIALQVVRDHAQSTAVVLAVAGAAGAAFAALYGRTRGVPMVLTVLAPAPVLFLGLFLVRAPVFELESDARALSIPEPKRDPPVVLVLLDEFPVPSIMGPDRTIDARRFPHFAELARESTWFRNATGVHEHTTQAVPAILSGRLPKYGELPIAQDHPDNLFTLLGKRYDLDVFESVTQLCPERICARETESFAERMRSLAGDVEVVYGHLVLPQRVEARLPPVTETWAGFRDRSHDDARDPGSLVVRNEDEVDRVVGRQMWHDQRLVWLRWTASIRRTERPTLYAMHALLPHYPWRYLPSGKQYGNSLGMDGVDEGVWTDDPWIVQQGWQRHLLQVGFTDRMMGELIARLRRTGLWDDALVIVTADHGSSFVAGGRRRDVTRANIADIASVPLFLKLPGGRGAGRVDDRFVRTLDIVPTIADVLGVPLPYGVGGHSLLSPRPVSTVTVQTREGRTVRAPARAVARGRDRTLRRQLRLFGSGDWSRVFDIAPQRGLLGRVAPRTARAAAASVSIDGESLLRSVDLRSRLSPSHVTGRVSDGPRDLAIAVNGRIAAVTRTFEVAGDHHFAAFVPERAFRQGANRVEVYAVRGGRLERLRGGIGDSGSSWTLAGNELRAGSRSIPIRPGELDGVVEDWFFERDTVRFGGWAGDTRRGRLPDAVLVFAAGRFVYSGTTTVGRARIPFAGKGPDDLVRIGFVFDLPRSIVGDRPLRFFAIRGDVASELGYVEDFPWRAS